MYNKHDIKDLKFISKLLDSQFKGPMGFKFGLDAIIGLIPVIGDSFTSIISSYIIYRAVQLGIPRIIILKMIFNLLIDQTIGIIPIIGDLFDLAWKASNKNYKLVDDYLGNPKGTLQKSYLTMLVFALLTLTIVMMPFFIFFLIIF